MLETGTKAPQFTLPDKDGNLVSLSDFAGKKVVVYFYPRDNTSGCTRQACAFAGVYKQFEKLGVPVIGISKDSVKSHQNFAAKHELPFILLSDPELHMLFRLMMYGKRRSFMARFPWVWYAPRISSMKTAWLRRPWRK